MKDWHYNSIQGYTLTNWGDTGYSTLIPAVDSQNPDGIEGILKSNRDAINAMGGITQTPVDLLSGGAGPAITSASDTVTLPAYGFTVLGVD